jgi:hypothetical protein
MSYTLRPDRIHMMPAHFGPSCGPRQGPDGGRFADAPPAKQVTYSVSFRTSPDQLARLLPPQFVVGADPVITVSVTYLTEIAWLAGRGYNIASVRFPAVFQGKRDQASGPFVAVLWENLCDPILTGREQLGYSKIYAEIPPPRVFDGRTTIAASWLGFEFLTMELSDVAPASTTGLLDRMRSGQGDGLLHYKYVPRTGAPWSEADAAYATISPVAVPDAKYLPEISLGTGTGAVRFRRARWEDLPTQFHIVNALSELEVQEVTAASVLHSVGATDLFEQRILE